MTSPNNFLATGFRDVDSSGVDKLRRCLEFLDHLPGFRDYKQRTYDLLAIQPASHCLDVACGLGYDVIRLASRCARSVGVDQSVRLLQEAKRQALVDTAGSSAEFAAGDAHALPFADATFDGVRIDRSLQHLADPAQVVREMTRVCCPGGRVVCAEPDWGTFWLGSPLAEQTQRVQDSWAQGFRNPWIGRELWSLLTRAGLQSVTVECWPLAVWDAPSANTVFDVIESANRALPEESRQEWLDSFLQAGGSAGVMLFIAAGVKR